MKTYLFGSILLVTLLTSLNLRAQGSGVVSYTTVGAPFDKRVYLFYTGRAEDSVALSGTGYQTALYWAPAGTTDDRTMVQIGQAVGFLTGANAGTFFGGGRTINGISANGGVVALQSRAWSFVAGIPNTYEAVVASGLPGVNAGKGPVFDMKLKDPTNPLETIPNIWQAAGWRAYMIGIPEPSTLALGALGIAALLLLRRKRC